MWTRRQIWNPPQGVVALLCFGWYVAGHWFNVFTRARASWARHKCRRTSIGFMLGRRQQPQCEYDRVCAILCFGHCDHPPIYNVADFFVKFAVLYLSWRAVAEAQSGKPSKGSHAGPTQKINLTPENPKFFSGPLLLRRPIPMQPRTRSRQFESFSTVLAIFTILAILAVLRHTAWKSTFYQQRSSLSSNLPQLLPRRDVLAPDNTTAQNRFWSASISEQFRLVAAALYEYGIIPVVVENGVRFWGLTLRGVVKKMKSRFTLESFIRY